MALVRILVDGYSLLHNWPEIAPGQARHSAAARDELIHVLTRYRDAIGTPVTIVFDGSRAPSGTPKPQSSPEMEILYSVDPARVYLMGHSMGANGTWRLGSKYADRFAALAPVAGGSAPPDADITRLASLPVFCAHGAADATAPVDASRRMVAQLREAGGDVTLFEVPEADHSGIVPLAVPKIFDFFDRHHRR